MENKSYEKVEIILNEKISEGIYKMDVKGEFKAKVGQFYMVKCFEDGTMLPRPISICDMEDNKLTFLYAVALVAGGIGIAPMLYLAKKLEADVDLYAGFRDEIYFTEEFKEFTKNTYIATNTGSVGHKGFITEIIKDDYDVIYCCGPNPMMNSVKNLGFDIPVYVSLESRMGCGIGACLACSCKTKNGMKRICKEGPVFEVKEVNF